MFILKWVTDQSLLNCSFSVITHILNHIYFIFHVHKSNETLIFLLKNPTCYWKIGTIVRAHEIKLDSFGFNNLY